jgi:hypothetical protein
MKKTIEWRPAPSRILACLAMACLTTGAPAIAARETSQALSAPDAAQLRRLAVVSLLGDSIHGTSSGLSVFQKRYLAAPAVWQIDPELEQRVADRVAASARLRGAEVRVLDLADPSAVLRRDRRRPVDTRALARIARERGYDAVLAILPEQHAAQPDAPAGVSILRRQQRGGGEDSRACAAVALRLLRAADGQPLAWAAPEPCSRRARPIPWHESWSDYTPEEAGATLDALRRQARLVVDEALRDLGLQPRVRPGNRGT